MWYCNPLEAGVSMVRASTVDIAELPVDQLFSGLFFIAQPVSDSEVDSQETHSYALT